jgi:NTE family protein
VLRALPEGDEELSRLGKTIERLMPDWDPRLRLVGVSLERGSRMMIGDREHFGLSVSEAVRASCAIPGVFRPVYSSAGPIVDGGVWSPVNLDAAGVKAGESVFCLYPSGYRVSPSNFRRRAVAGISRTRVSLEAAMVRSRGARVLAVIPDAAAAAAIGHDRMDHSRDSAVASAGYRQGHSLAAGLKGWLSDRTVSPSLTSV